MSLAAQVRRVSSNVETATRAAEFVTYARCLMAGGASGRMGSLEIAKQTHAGERVQEVLKAAIAAGTTTDSTWAAPLVGYQQIANGFLESLRHLSAYQEMLSANAFRVVPFRSRLGTITSGPAAYRVAELGRKPVSRLTLSSDLLDNEIKVVSIIVISNELARFSGPAGATLFGNELRKAVGVEVDVNFFAELLSSSVPSVPSSGASAADAWSDLQYLLASVPLSATSAPYFIAGSVAATSLATRSTAGQAAFPTLGPMGGTALGIPLLISDGIDENTLVLVDASRVVVADAGIILDSSEHANLALSDDGTGAPSSLWQQNATALKCERIFSMAPQDGCVAYVSNVGSS